jgi:hypothetical protein
MKITEGLRLSVYISRKLYLLLKKEADENNRSVSNLATNIFLDYFKRKNQKP